MTILKLTHKVIRIETFVIWLSGGLMIMNAVEIKLFSLTSSLILIGISILFLLLDARMVTARRDISRAQGLQMTGILFIAGLFLLFSPITVFQVTRLDTFETASLILGIILLLINSVLFVALWALPRDISSS